MQETREGPRDHHSEASLEHMGGGKQCPQQGAQKAG